MPEYRAHFDFDIRFANGGEIAGTGFRLDLPSHSLSTDEIGLLLVKHLGLALVDEVELRGSAHRRGAASRQPGSRSEPAPTAPTAGRRPQPPDPSRARDLPRPAGPTITPHLTREDSRARYAPGTEFAMDVITMIGNTGTYLDSPFHRYAEGPDLAGLDARPRSSGCAPRSSTSRTRGRLSAAASVPRPLADRDVRGAAVLLHTGWDRWFGRPEYGDGAPFLTGEGSAVAHRRGRRARRDRLAEHRRHRVRRRAPSALAAARGRRARRGAPHEPRCAAAAGARFTAAPPAVEGFGTFPVRAFAEVPS